MPLLINSRAAWRFPETMAHEYCEIPEDLILECAEKEHRPATDPKPVQSVLSKAVPAFSHCQSTKWLAVNSVKAYGCSPTLSYLDMRLSLPPADLAKIKTLTEIGAIDVFANARFFFEKRKGYGRPFK